MYLDPVEVLSCIGAVSNEEDPEMPEGLVVAAADLNEEIVAFILHVVRRMVRGGLKLVFAQTDGHRLDGEITHRNRTRMKFLKKNICY